VTFHAGVFAGLLASASVALLLPPVLTVLVWRRFRPWLVAVAVGAGTFFVFQVVTRIPLVVALTGPMKRLLEAHPGLTALWLAVLSFTAGLFEETGRWTAYRVLPRLRSRANGLLMGVGHGGLEAVLLVGINMLVAAGLYAWLGTGHPLPFHLTDAQRVVLDRQFASLTPGLALLGGVERVSAMTLHCGLSLVVLEGFRRRQRRWLWLSMGYHGLANFCGVLAVKAFGPVSAEGVIAVFSLLALWWTVRWMRAGEAAPA